MGVVTKAAKVTIKGTTKAFKASTKVTKSAKKEGFGPVIRDKSSTNKDAATRSGKLKLGDVFAIPLPNSKYAFGRRYRDASIGIYKQLVLSG